MDIGLRIFAGLCIWKKTEIEETQINVEEIKQGEICFGKLNIITPKEEEKVIEDTTEEIEEYHTKYIERGIDKEVREKLNEVIRAVNKLNKLHEPPIIDTFKETNCMTD